MKRHGAAMGRKAHMERAAAMKRPWGKAHVKQVGSHEAAMESTREAGRPL